MSGLRAALLLAVGSICSGQIEHLATNGNGSELYFVTDLNQYGARQPQFKLMLIRDGVLDVVEVSRYPIYSRPAVSMRGSVRAINRTAQCEGEDGACLLREGASSVVQAHSGKLFDFDGLVSVSPNGRFAAIFGDKTRSIRRLDLQTMEETLLGREALEDGQVVADDGTVLVAGANGGIRLVSLNNRAVDLRAARKMTRAVLAADVSRIIYATGDRDTAGSEIRVIETATGEDRLLGAGYLPMVAVDGRHFSYLNSTTGPDQVWLGDAATGLLSPLSKEPVGIFDETITGDGSTVFAATNMERLLSIDTGTGAVKQIFGTPISKAAPLARVTPANGRQF